MTQTTQHPDQADAELARTPRPGFWLAAVAAGLALAGLIAVGLRTDLAGVSPSTTVPESGTLQVSGTGVTKTILCHAGYLSVSGQKNTITLTGHCTSVSVSGSGNHVAVDSVDAVSASGTGNVVVYHWGSPKIDNVGTANIVRQG
ncbi:hypothetical protein B8W69_01725 [Mycobacterium vulneris]|jgi:hypothetical protein|uniref:DUF3060 domain-containing protein n=1 Tax=Mycolicibacterium vulneris TaxID=547163 RepID=A0A1X2LET3_9MYCO|nr:DUF3060 domain-containing protein [Mycolicibacterium vulneris]OSC32520.1 hypothetical protein B8W69_01725 [Mycolicibacterium vulneris]